MKRSPVLAVTFACAFAVAAVPRAAAHPGHSPGTAGGGALPGVAFLVGLAVLAGSVYADHRELVDRRAADVGVLVGIVALLAGGVWFWL